MNYNISQSCQIDHDFYQNLLQSTFKDRNGFFIDIGAYDGLECSNTSCLVEAGWEGLMIEPDKDSYEVCQQRYINNPLIQVINVAISNETKVLPFYKADALSTLEMDGLPVNRAMRSDKFSGKRLIQAYRLDTILSTLYPVDKKIDLLSVDVEGHEWCVFEHFCIKKYKPKICIVEMHSGPRPDSGKLSEFRNETLIHNLEDYFNINDYELIYSDHINNIYEQN